MFRHFLSASHDNSIDVDDYSDSDAGDSDSDDGDDNDDAATSKCRSARITSRSDEIRHLAMTSANFGTKTVLLRCRGSYYPGPAQVGPPTWESKSQRAELAKKWSQMSYTTTRFVHK